MSALPLRLLTIAYICAGLGAWLAFHAGLDWRISLVGFWFGGPACVCALVATPGVNRAFLRPVELDLMAAQEAEAKEAWIAMETEFRMWDRDLSEDVAGQEIPAATGGQISS